jgi:hypothetical protein
VLTWKSIYEIQKWSMCVSIILQLRYYHSRTGAPIHPEHLEWDSDDDVDHEWLVQQVPSDSSRSCAASTHSGCATLWSMAVRGRGGALRGRVCSRLRAFAATRLSPTVGEERAACTCHRCGWLRRYTVGADRSAV